MAVRLGGDHTVTTSSTGTTRRTTSTRSRGAATGGTSRSTSARTSTRAASTRTAAKGTTRRAATSSRASTAAARRAKETEAEIRLQVEKAAAGAPKSREVVFRLPFMTARIEVEPPPAQGGLRLGPLTLPSPKKTAYYAGLGVLALAEVIEWPIAAAIAAGTYIAQHSRPEAPAVGQVPHLRFIREEEHVPNGHRQPAHA